MRSARLAASAVALITGMTAPLTTPAAEQSPARELPATVVQPRSFGHVIGDVVTQRVLLPPAFEPKALTTPQRVSLWLERRASRIDTTSDGQRWLIVDYQVTNAPQALAAAGLPAWTLVSTNGAKLAVAPSALTIGALIPAGTAPTVEQLRPDRAAVPVPTAAARARFRFALFALALTLAAWFAWSRWRDLRERANLPFARALHEMEDLGEATPQAWQKLHRAFDRTAGRVIQLDTLPTLFQRAPYLQPLRAEIERFFTQSSERFFGTGLSTAPVSALTLCRELQRLERRFAR